MRWDEELLDLFNVPSLCPAAPTGVRDCRVGLRLCFSPPYPIKSLSRYSDLRRGAGKNQQDGRDWPASALRRAILNRLWHGLFS